MTLFNSN